MSDFRTEVDGRALSLSNLDKVLYPDGTTKAEVIQYYLTIAPAILPHVANRCLTRLRVPDGVQQDGFYEKNAPAGTPDWVRRATVVAREGTIDYVVAESAATLVWLANLAAVELHTPQWQLPRSGADIVIDAEGGPLVDRIIVDLDPGEGITMADSALSALVVAARLAEDGLVGFVKTTGSKGLQVTCPVQPTDWMSAMSYVRAVGDQLSAADPARFTTVMAKDARRGRIFIDYLQNRSSRNTIAPWSLRARDTPTVATPLTWREVAEATDGAPLSFTWQQACARWQTDGDPWDALFDPSMAAVIPRATART